MKQRVIHSSAVFSDCRTWRYTLTRIWDFTRDRVMFIGLNPSTADEVDNDPTVTRCIGYARDWGYGGLIMTNIFAFRAAKPRDMKAAADPVGPDNDFWLKDCFWRTRPFGIMVAAWGNHGAFQQRGKIVEDILGLNGGVELYCLGITKAGEPKHPLYLPKRLQPSKYQG